jgi:threonine 3-dehydrogenase
LGTGLCEMLGQKYGKENVWLSDIKRLPNHIKSKGINFTYADILDVSRMRQIVIEKQINWIVHFSALLSAVAEQNVQLALSINVTGMQNIINLGKDYGLKVFIPSTIGAFGPETPRNPTPDFTIQRPKTIYGVTKVYAELLGEYYAKRFGTDFRSLRFPGVISADTLPGGGTTGNLKESTDI